MGDICDFSSQASPLFFVIFKKIFVKKIYLERKRKNVIFSFSSLKKYLSYDDDSDEDEDEGFDISM